VRAAAFLVVLVGCASASPDRGGLSVDPPNVKLFVREAAMLDAVSMIGDDVSFVMWTSQDESIAEVDGNGGAATVRGITAGSTTILVDLNRSEATVSVEIDDAAVDSVTVTADRVMVPKNLSAQFIATVNYTDGRAVDMSDMVDWESSNTGVATVRDGAVKGVAPGAAEISATFMGKTGTKKVTVTNATVNSITVATPAPVAKGLHAQLSATGKFSDGSTQDITSLVTWTAVNPGVATVDASGSVQAVAVGSTEIDASLEGVTGKTTVQVSSAVVVSLTLSTGDFTLAESQRAHIRAELVLSDNSRSDVTSTATWQSSAPTVITASAGQIDSQLQASTAMVTATANGQTASVNVTVSATACHPVINEVQAAGASSSDEWVEIYNPCTIVWSVANWTLVYRSSGTVGATDSNSLATLTGTMSPGDLRLYAGAGYTGTSDGQWGGGSSGLLAATNGAIGLRSGPKDTGSLVDSVGYGTLNAGHPFVEGTPAPALATGKSIARLPFDGNDTNDGGSNFVLVTTPTPRARNAP
jgi:hypothetical protein